MADPKRKFMQRVEFEKKLFYYQQTILRNIRKSILRIIIPCILYKLIWVGIKKNKTQIMMVIFRLYFRVIVLSGSVLVWQWPWNIISSKYHHHNSCLVFFNSCISWVYKMALLFGVFFSYISEKKFLPVFGKRKKILATTWNLQRHI
jgi:hypothetical protein